MTTSKRPDLFGQTVKSLVQNCRDLSLISKVLVIDDNSPSTELALMSAQLKDLFPGVEVEICTSPSLRGHARGMQLLYSKLVGEFVFHCEDDWEFVHSGRPITEALDVLETDPAVGQVSFSREAPLTKVHTTPAGTSYWLWKYDGAESCVPGKHSSWPCFTLNPSILRVSALRRTGNFFDISNFEFEYGRRWVEAECKTAYLQTMFARHIGGARSAYEINRSPR